MEIKDKIEQIKDKIEQIKDNEDVVEILKLTLGIVEKYEENIKLCKQTLFLGNDTVIKLYTILISITKKYNVKELNIEELETTLQIYKAIYNLQTR